MTFTVRGRRFTTAANAEAAYLEDTKAGKWTVLGLLGLWYHLYKKHFDMDYYVGTKSENFAEVEHIVQIVGPENTELAFRALFSDKMAWVNGKTLRFFTPSNLQRFAVPVGLEMKRKTAASPEWTTQSVASSPTPGLISKPKGG